MKTLSILVFSASLMLSMSSILAAESSKLPAPQKGVIEFVSPDGRIDIEAIRQSGYQGPLDLKGYEVHIDPNTGQPSVQSAMTSFSASDPDDIYWDSSIAEFFKGGIEFVSAFAVYDSNLIVGGNFTTGGAHFADYITSWDGTSWSALGIGTNGIVHALTIYHNKLIAGGAFDFATDISANYIASWDGTFWSPLGTGMNGPVWTLTVYNDKLIAGGPFNVAGGVSANNIASWNGISWSALRTGTDGTGAVLALTVYNNNLIAGGGFSSAGGVGASRIASWNGASWSALGTGIGRVNALTTYNNNLIAGGNFVQAGSVHADKIASWDGTTWSALGTGLNASVWSLTVYDNMLIAGGEFTTAGGSSANSIASWDGTSWSALGSGITGDVFALTGHNDNLIVGGNFVSAGNKRSRKIAQWTKRVATDVEEIEYPALPDGYKLSQNYPNPFNPETVIEFDLPRRSNVSITVFNLLGQKVAELVNEEIAAGSYRVSWDGLLSSGQRASSGIYFYRLITEDFIDTKKMLLLK